MELLKFLNYAPAVAGIVGMIVVVKIFVGYIGNHMGEIIKTNTELKDAIQAMLRFLERK